MALKRKANDSEIPVEKPQRRYEDTIQKEIIMSDGDNMNVTCMSGGVVNFSLFEFEAMIRRVVREELAAAKYQSPRSTPYHCSGIPEAKPFELRFNNKLKKEYFTQNKILAEGDAPVQIVLFDVGSQTIVTKGPMSSIKIQICALPGDFESDHRNWTREEFNASILRQREGKKALLKGETSITLRDGVGLIPKIEFTDNSCWVRTRTFRLAAKSNKADIREAASEPFAVKDKRGEPNKKPDRPSLNSEVWRLRNIGKGGKFHTQLSNGGIETVKDLMRLYTTNPSLLKEKFGSCNKWEDIIEHAKACVIDDNEHYLYYATEKQLLFVFNSIYEVKRVSFDGQNYHSPETLDSDGKRLVEVAKLQAYQNVEDFIPGPVDLTELENLQVGRSSGPQDHPVPPESVDLLAAPQGQELDWALHGGSGLYSIFPFPFPNDFTSPSSEQLHFEADFGCPSFQFLLNSAAATSNNRRCKTVWNKIRAALKWLILRRSLCR